MDTGRILQCPKCGAKYKLLEHHTMTRDKDSVCCQVCYTDLFSWNGASMVTLERISENNIEIRQAQKTDFLDLSTLCDETEQWHMQVKIIANNLLHSIDENCRCYLAFLNGAMVGFVYGHIIDKQTLYPQFMYVKKETRNCEIGKQLMQRLEYESGCSVSMIYYHRSLHDYYAHQGYETSSELEAAIKQLGGENTHET